MLTNQRPSTDMPHPSALKWGVLSRVVLGQVINNK